ncbi:MAG: transglutaminase-like domain-containing protein [Methanotrichaceae archaeon]|nr:transglutaminase-like domain-containing protein [Methanotrichaceae archaeon]
MNGEILMNPCWKNQAIVALSLIFMLLMLSSGSDSGSDTGTIKNQFGAKGTDNLFNDAKEEYKNQNYRTAAGLFSEVYKIYLREEDAKKALDARNWKLRSDRMTFQFPYNWTEAEKEISVAFQDLSEEQRRSWLEQGISQQLVSDGEVLYFEDIVKNIKFHNFDLIRKAMKEKNKTSIYDDVKEIAFQDAVNCSKHFCNPITYEGSGTLSIPRDMLPMVGLLRLWIPLPVETDSQLNLAIRSVEPAEYVRKGPSTDGDMGIVYLEIPLDRLEEDLNASVKFRFTEYEKHFTIDPAQVGIYDIDSDLYRKYTRSYANIVVTPEITKTAQSIVGNETNPLLQAQAIYRSITEKLPYSHVPHITLDTAGIPESLYVHETGFGDCGSQSMYFCALCRSLGIPARTIGGMQLIPGIEGDHFWAEFYLPEYGWIPVDVTIAEAAEWSFNASQEERNRFKDFYFGNLDAYRFVIQKDVDITLDPDPGNAVIFSTVHQYPAAVCTNSENDIDLIMEERWNFSLTPIEPGPYSQEMVKPA